MLGDERVQLAHAFESFRHPPLGKNMPGLSTTQTSRWASAQSIPTKIIGISLNAGTRGPRAKESPTN
jgi:hypothetical protein